MQMNASAFSRLLPAEGTFAVRSDRSLHSPPLCAYISPPMSGEIPEGQQWTEQQAATMRMAAGYEPDMRQRLFERRGITLQMFAAFCAAESIVPEGEGEVPLTDLPPEERMQIDIGRFRTQLGKRLVSGLDRLLQAEEWSTLAELQGLPDTAITAKSGVGAVSVQALNEICGLLGFERDGKTGRITEKKK